MSIHPYEPDTYRYCQYLEIEYAKDESGKPMTVKLGDRIVTKKGGKGIVKSIQDIRVGDTVDQCVNYRDEEIPDEQAQTAWQDTDGSWQSVDSSIKWSPIDEIVEVHRNE